jgi:hypothetical protein
MTGFSSDRISASGTAPGPFDEEVFMKLPLFLSIKAVISIVSGLALLLIPGALMGLAGVTLDPGGTVMARLLGALLIGSAVMCWTARNADPSVGREAFVLGLFVADTLGFVVILLAQLAGLMTGLGWVFVLLWLLLAAGLGYFRFMAK